MGPNGKYQFESFNTSDSSKNHANHSLLKIPNQILQITCIQFCYYCFVSYSMPFAFNFIVVIFTLNFIYKIVKPYARCIRNEDRQAAAIECHWSSSDRVLCRDLLLARKLHDSQQQEDFARKIFGGFKIMGKQVSAQKWLYKYKS